MCHDDMMKRIFGIFGFGDDEMILGVYRLYRSCEYYPHSAYTLLVDFELFYISPGRWMTSYESWLVCPSHKFYTILYEN
jgi:hypothetical protein